jgi:hypothetical protein
MYILHVVSKDLSYCRICEVEVVDSLCEIGLLCSIIEKLNHFECFSSFWNCRLRSYAQSIKAISLVIYEELKPWFDDTK